MIVEFSVEGTPRAKQSFKVTTTVNGKISGYTPAITKVWQNEVSKKARQVMGDIEPFTGKLIALLEFYLPDNHRRDTDNLSKAVLDACNGIVWDDDKQIIMLIITKNVVSNGEPTGVAVHVTDALDTQRVTEAIMDILFRKGD